MLMTISNQMESELLIFSINPSGQSGRVTTAYEN